MGLREPQKAQEEAIRRPSTPGMANEEVKEALQGFTGEGGPTFGNYPLPYRTLSPSDPLPWPGALARGPGPGPAIPFTLLYSFRFSKSVHTVQHGKG